MSMKPTVPGRALCSHCPCSTKCPTRSAGICGAATLSRTLGITTAVLGDPAHFATNRWASGAATRAVKAAVRARRRELAIADAMESAAAAAGTRNG